MNDSNWQIEDLGDYNSDGKQDILWRNQRTGALGYWQLNGTQLISAQPIKILGSEWQTVAGGQFA
jgi:hypothetical protein